MRNPLTLESFADWCAKQPAEKRYSYWDGKNCACAQYARRLGFDSYINDCLGPALWRMAVAFITFKWRERTFWYRADSMACKHPRTFGALATRLRAGARQ